MPRRKKKKKLFYLGVKSNGKHLAKEVNEDKEKKESETIKNKRVTEVKKQNKIEEKQKKKENIKRIENIKKEIEKNKKKDTKEELKNNKYRNRKCDDQIFDFDKEVVLGINNNITKKADKKKTKAKAKKKIQKKRKRVSLIIKCTSIMAFIIGIIIFTMTSEEFTIKEIVVSGNSRLGTDTITELSGVTLGENIFRININNIISNIKNNTYIKSVEIERELPTKLKITVSERTSAYVLECAGNYMYIDAQGYLLELTNQAIDLPIITGFEESEEELLKIKRLNSKDLSKLNDVLKMTETLKGYELYEYINKFDISQNKDYVIYMEKLGKTVYIGDTLDLNNKILHLKIILDKIEGKTGRIFVNGNLNEGFKPYFSEDI